MSFLVKLNNRRSRILDLPLLPEAPEGRIAGEAVMPSRTPRFFAGIRSFPAKAAGTIQRTIALLTISLRVLGIASQKAAAQSYVPVLTSATSASSTSVTLTWTESDPQNGWFRVLYGTSSGH